MAVYGRTIYGTETYGYLLPPNNRVDPFIAVPASYNSINLSWSTPSGTILAYRLVKNRFGFPTDQDDGVVLIDSVAFPGNQFTDTNVNPGQYHYYAFYILTSSDFVNQWVRSATTAVLMPVNFQSGLQINEFMPNFYKQQEELSPVVPAAFPTTTLDFFCNVLGWGFDYLKTQYDSYQHVNDPWKIPLKDLINLATQLGINVNPDIHPYTLRKAVYYNATVNQNRGTTAGLVQELDILTGWSADLQLAPNFMLENDQSGPVNPQFPAWSANIEYVSGERVTFGNFDYTRTSAASGIGNAPTGANSNNTWWNVTTNLVLNSFINNPLTGGVNTWEAVNPASSTGQFSNFTSEVIGIVDPLNSASNIRNGFWFQNSSGSTATVLARSISRAPGDFAANGPEFPPNKDQVVGDGVPVPFVTPALEWNGTNWLSNVRYGTDQIITYGNVPFIALGASTGIVPPVTGHAAVSNQWAAVGMDPRIRICISAYTQATTTGITVTPYVTWYDANGRYITRVVARNTTPGSNTRPTGVVYDSFTYPINTSTLNARITDDGAFSWSQTVGSFNKSPYSEGCIYPNTGARSYATVNAGVSDGQFGLTFVTSPASGFNSGLLLRFLNDTNYIIATMTGILANTGGTFNNLGTYSTPAQPGDRLIVTLSGSSITAFINGNQVLTTTSTQNQTGTIHGVIYDTVGTLGPGGNVVVTNPGPQSNTVNQGI